MSSIQAGESHIDGVGKRVIIVVPSGDNIDPWCLWPWRPSDWEKNQFVTRWYALCRSIWALNWKSCQVLTQIQRSFFPVAILGHPYQPLDEQPCGSQVIGCWISGPVLLAVWTGVFLLRSDCPENRFCWCCLLVCPECSGYKTFYSEVIGLRSLVLSKSFSVSLVFLWQYSLPRVFCFMTSLGAGRI